MLKTDSEYYVMTYVTVIPLTVGFGKHFRFFYYTDRVVHAKRLGIKIFTEVVPNTSIFEILTSF